MYGAMMLAPNPVLAAQALLAQAALANAQAQMQQAQMMPQAFGALSPFAAAPVVPPTVSSWARLLPRPLTDYMSEPYGFAGERRWQFQPIGGRLPPGAPLLPFAATPPLPAAQPVPAAPPTPLAAVLSQIPRSSFSQFFKPRWGDTIPDYYGQGPKPISALLPFAAAPVPATVPAQPAAQPQQPPMTLHDLLSRIPGFSRQLDFIPRWDDPAFRQTLLPFAVGPEFAPMFIPPTAQQMLAIQERLKAILPRPPQLPPLPPLGAIATGCFTPPWAR